MVLLREAKQRGMSLGPAKGSRAFSVSWLEFVGMLPNDPNKTLILSKIRKGSFVAVYGKNSILVARTNKLPSSLLKQIPSLQKLGKIWEILDLPIMNVVKEINTNETQR